MKKTWLVILTACSLLFIMCSVPVGKAFGAVTKQQYKKNLKYNKNALPAGWKYEAGYTVWRINKKLAATPQTYKKYRRERKWAKDKTVKPVTVDDILLGAADWTVEEIAFLLENYKEFLIIHPAGVEE